MPPPAHGIQPAEIDRQIQLLIRNLVEIKDTSGEFLLKLDDGRVIDTKGWNDWEWTHGIGLYGIYKYYEQTRDARCREIMLHWFRDRFAAGPPTKNINTVAPFLTLAYLYEEQPNGAWLPYLDEWAEWLMNGLPRTEENGFQHIVFNSENRQQLWDDTLMMSVMPLAKIGRLLGRPHYVEEARRQFMLHIKYLVDRKTGLWFHGWTFDGRHHFANALWARGNCWVTIAIPEFIELLELPPGDGLREFLLETHLQQIRTLVRHQDDGGLWHTLIDDPASYLEASATAGFAYGILKSVRLGFIGHEYHDAGVRAVKAVLANIDAERRAQERVVRHARVQRSRWLPQHSPDIHAVRPGHGHPRAGRVQAGLHLMAARPVRLGHYIAYGANDFLGAGAMSIIGIWILFFYTTYCGLTAAEAGIIFVAARLLDAFFSPVIGYISDYFHHTWLGKKFGRRRFFILLADSPAARASRSCGWKARASGTTCHLLLLRAGVRDGDHPVRNARRGDVAELPDQGEIRRRTHHLRTDRQHRRAMAAGGSSSCSSAARSHASTFLYLGVCSRCSSCSWRWPSIYSPGSGRATRSQDTTSRRQAVRSSATSASCSRISRPRCASARSGCTSACTSAATSARTSSTACSPTSSRSRWRAAWSPPRMINHRHGRSRSWSPWCSPSGWRCAFIPAPSYRIAVTLFAR